MFKPESFSRFSKFAQQENDGLFKADQYLVLQMDGNQWSKSGVVSREEAILMCEGAELGWNDVGDIIENPGIMMFIAV